MCFSAASSFTSSALLAIITYASVRKVTSKKQYYLIAMLGFYTLMQIIEGFEWLAFQNQFFPSFFIPLAAYYFFFISYLVWPLGMPVSLYMVEQDERRKKKLKWLSIIVSIMVLCVWIAKLLHPEPPTAAIVNNSIQYSFHIFQNTINDSPLFNNPAPFGFIFVFIFFLAVLFSSLKGKWIPFLLTVGTFALATYMYSYAFTSVWCFFSCAVAATVYILLDLNPMSD